MTEMEKAEHILLIAIAYGIGALVAVERVRTPEMEGPYKELIEALTGYKKAVEES